jgi:uncharacterized protein with FMN-binding domain
MKKLTIFGIILAMVMVLFLAACDTGGGTAGHGLFTPGTHVITVPMSTGATGDLPRVTAHTTDPAVLAAAPAYSNHTNMVLSVTFSRDRITDITLVSHGESGYAQKWFQRAYPMVTDQILFRQSTMDIDIPTGATVTRNALLRGVNEAIVAAGANPSALVPHMGRTPMAGDLFVPGFYTYYLPGGTYNIWGQPIDWSASNNRLLYRPNSLANFNRGRGIEGEPLSASDLAAYGNSAERVAMMNSILTPGLNTHTPLIGGWSGLFVQVAVARNSFYLIESTGGDGLVPSHGGERTNALVGRASGDSIELPDTGTGAVAPQAIEGLQRRALGHHWWGQQAHLMVNEQQSTLGITPDTTSFATQSGMAVRAAMERVLGFAAGGTLPHLPIQPHNPRWIDASQPGLTLIPGRTNAIPVPGFPGITIDIGLDRNVIRFIGLTVQPNADNRSGPNFTSSVTAVTDSAIAAVFGAGATVSSVQGTGAADTLLFTRFVERIQLAFARTHATGGRELASIAEVEPIAGQQAFSAAVIQAVTEHLKTKSLEHGGPGGGPVNQAGRIGHP